jgi:hypothetical protein
MHALFYFHIKHNSEPRKINATYNTRQDSILLYNDERIFKIWNLFTILEITTSMMIIMININMDPF